MMGMKIIMMIKTIVVLTAIIALTLLWSGKLRMGDRVLAVNTTDIRIVTHQEAVMALLQHCQVSNCNCHHCHQSHRNQSLEPWLSSPLLTMSSMSSSSNNQSPKNGHHNLPGDEVDRPTRPPAPGLQGDLSGEAAWREAGNDHQGRPEVMIMMVMMMAMMIIEGGLRW